MKTQREIEQGIKVLSDMQKNPQLNEATKIDIEKSIQLLKWVIE